MVHLWKALFIHLVNLHAWCVASWRSFRKNQKFEGFSWFYQISYEPKTIKPSIRRKQQHTSISFDKLPYVDISGCFWLIWNKRYSRWKNVSTGSKFSQHEFEKTLKHFIYYKLNVIMYKLIFWYDLVTSNSIELNQMELCIPSSCF